MHCSGLELDAVVVVEPADIAGADLTRLRHLDIALTRTTTFLAVVRTREFALLGMSAGVPGEESELSAPPQPEAVRTDPVYAVSPPSREEPQDDD